MQSQRQYCLTLDLRDDGELIREYEQYHQKGNTWPEVIASIRESGILDMQIYRSGTQLIMVMTVNDSFSFEDKARRDSQNPKVIEWERLMARFQRANTDAGADAKWQKLRNIFDLSQHSSTTD
jgi:L-rhamnose mutarotase